MMLYDIKQRFTDQFSRGRKVETRAIGKHEKKLTCEGLRFGEHAERIENISQMTEENGQAVASVAQATSELA